MLFGGNRNSPLGIIGVILTMVLAPMAAMLVQMAISRAREYEADELGAKICGQPLWLASALGGLSRSAAQIDNEKAEQNPATAHMFIVNPLHARSIDGLFSTHPPMEERIRRLQAMSSGGGRPFDGGGADGGGTGGSSLSGSFSRRPANKGPWG